MSMKKITLVLVGILNLVLFKLNYL